MATAEAQPKEPQHISPNQYSKTATVHLRRAGEPGGGGGQARRQQHIHC